MSKTGEMIKKPRLGIFLELWAMMMGLVLLTVGCMWFGQVLFLEKNYADATLASARERLRPVMEDLTSSDLAGDPKFLPFLSRITDGTLYLASPDGSLIGIYSNGKALTDASSEPEFHLWETRLSQAALETIQNQEPFQKLHTKDQRIDAILMPFSVTYGGADAFLVLFNRLDLSAVTRLNRQQLIFMSAFLTLSAAILAAGFSRHFTKPILTIRDTVDRLAGNDFDARADIRRRDELGDLAASVGLLGQALSRIDVLRKELIANVSHELRSPLAVIAGYAEMVRDIHWKDPQMREEDLDLIIHEARRMSEMVNDILDYSQLQSGYTALHPEVCSFCALVRREIDACLARSAEYRIPIRFLPPAAEVQLLADPLKMSQVLRNLLYNAINHTPEGEEITVSVTKRSSLWRLSVANPGEPIPEADRQIIWERYQRSQHQSGRHMGTGIGLSIVSTILAAHHMEYGVNCANGQTIFWFEFPGSGSL